MGRKGLEVIRFNPEIMISRKHGHEWHKAKIDSSVRDEFQLKSTRWRLDKFFTISEQVVSFRPIITENILFVIYHQLMQNPKVSHLLTGGGGGGGSPLIAEW